MTMTLTRMLSSCALISFAAAAGCAVSTVEGLAPEGASDGGPFGGTEIAVCSADAGAPTPILPGKMTPFNPKFEGAVSSDDPPPPISGGTLTVLRDGHTAVAADPDRDRVYVVNLDTRTVTHSIALRLHDEPGRLVEDAAGLVHVALRNAGAIASINPALGEVALRRAACGQPRGMAYDAVSDQLYVACAGGELLTFAPSGATPVRTLKLASDLRDVVIDGENLMITRFRSAEVLIVRKSDGAMMESIRPASLTDRAVLDGQTFEPAVAWRAVGTPEGGAVMVHQRGTTGNVATQAGGYGVDTCRNVVHTCVTRVKAGRRPAPGPAMADFPLPVDLAVSQDGKRMAIVSAGNGHLPAAGQSRRLFVTGVDEGTSEWVSGGCPSDGKHGPQSGCGLSGSGASTQILPLIDSGNGGAEMTSGAGGVGGSGSGASAGGMANTGGGLGGSTGSDVIECPTDLQDLDAEAIAVAFVDATHLVVQTREPARLWLIDDVTNEQTAIDLSKESRADVGHAVFHTNTGNGLACASCHPEGHEDGRTWLFQCEGARRTQDISGGISKTAPYHWNGDLTDFDTLMTTVFQGRMAGPLLTREQGAAVLSWVDRIPVRAPVRDPADASAMRGRALFHDSTVGCATCHQGASLTSNVTVDVGTNGMFQVPGLRGLAWRAPYMHNGCAPTLTGRFGNALCDGGDKHGKTSQLKPDEIVDLVAYLESL